MPLDFGDEGDGSTSRLSTADADGDAAENGDDSLNKTKSSESDDDILMKAMLDQSGFASPPASQKVEATDMSGESVEADVPLEAVKAKTSSKKGKGKRKSSAPTKIPPESS